MTGAGLTRHRREIGSAFDLLGRDENHLTAALAFTLARSPALLARVLHRVLPASDGVAVSLRLEERDDQGRTDLEIEAGTQLAIIEAKRGASHRSPGRDASQLWIGPPPLDSPVTTCC